MTRCVFELEHLIGKVLRAVGGVVIGGGGEVGVAEDGLHGGGLGFALHKAGGGGAAQGVRGDALLFWGVLLVDAAERHEAAERGLGGVDILFPAGGSGEQKLIAQAVKDPTGKDGPDLGQDGDAALASGVGLFAADQVALVQMHVLPAEGEQLVDPHAGVDEDQRELGYKSEAVAIAGVLSDTADGKDLGVGEGALLFGRGRGELEGLGIVGGDDVVALGPLAELAEQLPLLFAGAAGEAGFGQRGDDLLVVLGLEVPHLPVVQRRGLGEGLLIAVLAFGADVCKVDGLPLFVDVTEGIAHPGNAGVPGVVLVQRQNGLGRGGVHPQQLPFAGAGHPRTGAGGVVHLTDAAAASGAAALPALGRGGGFVQTLAAPGAERCAVRDGLFAARAVHGKNSFPNLCAEQDHGTMKLLRRRVFLFYDYSPTDRFPIWPRRLYRTELPGILYR